MIPAYYNEIDDFCAGVLRRRIADGTLPPGDVDTRDIREVGADDLRGYGQIHLFAGIGGFAYAARLGGLPDGFPILTGGFPCQPWSCAGQRRGESDDRHLWPEMHRLVAAVRPAWVLGENVAGLVGMALDGVLSDLESAGYACWLAVIPACAVDAPHRRDRVWIVAYCDDGRRERWRRSEKPRGGATSDAASLCKGRSDPLAHPDQPGPGQGRQQRGGQQRGAGGDPESCAVEHAALDGRREGRAESGVRSGRTAAAEPGGAEPVGDADGVRCEGQRGRWKAGTTEPGEVAWITGADGKARRVPEPGFRLLAHGIPGRIPRLKALGNAIQPQVAAEIMRAMCQAEAPA